MLDLIGDVPAPKGTSDEAKAARKNEDLFSTLAQIGFGMAAGESPNALTNIGKAAAAAVPGMQEAIKERRKDTKEELQQQYAYELAKHGLSKDALVAAVGRTDTMTKNELAKVTALAEIKSKQIEGDKDRAVQRSGQANTSKYYDYLMNKDPKQLEQYAGIISKAKGISMDQARAEAMNVLNPGYTRGTKLTPYQAEQSARADYKIAFPMNPPPGGAEAWIRNKTAEKLAGGGDGETPNPANRIRLNAQGLPE
jgi:type II secretory pathway pseudopilin PulG